MRTVRRSEALLRIVNLRRHFETYPPECSLQDSCHDSFIDAVTITVFHYLASGKAHLARTLGVRFVEADRRSAPATPRWVKVLGAIALVLLVLFVVLHLTGHGFGGHSMHGGGH